MKLYLIHVGFYDSELMGGIYEQHGNIFVVAKNVTEAKIRSKENVTFKKKKMHIDGIQEINSVEGYRIHLVKEKEKMGSINYGYDEIKKLK